MNKKCKKILMYTTIGLLYILAYTIYVIVFWSKDVLFVDPDMIISTITTQLKGADMSITHHALKFCIPRIIIVIILFVIGAIIDYKIRFSLFLEINFIKKTFKINVIKTCRIIAIVLSIFLIFLSIIYMENQYGLIEYIRNGREITTIYEDYYVNPNDVNISLSSNNGKYKNLIYIYLESMETTYTSIENGGKQEVDYIPNLVSLANNNISFSNTELLGGYLNVNGTQNTMGALTATTSGVPYNFSVRSDITWSWQNFASGLTNLGDILASFGYNQEFLCGSDADFAGRRSYLEQHGNYKIFDLYTAREKGYIAEDYYVWWGYEDKRLYEIAKDELLELSSKKEPFNFTMLTVDTHMVSGYKCSLCENKYNVRTANIVSCADKQINNFINWCKQQEFYKDTVIIVAGDHPRTDKFLVDNISENERGVYNCFINCDIQENTVTQNRIFTAMDMFPTVLSALNFKWEGNRLGLGTNLFSSQQTLAEEIGINNLRKELCKKSNYYIEHFY